MKPGCTGKYAEWVRTDNLKEGDELRDFVAPWEVQRSYDAGWLAGMLDGEGTVEGKTAGTHGLRVGVSQRPGDELNRIKDLMSRFGIPLGAPTGSGSAIAIRVLGMAASLRLLGSIRPSRLLREVSWEGVGLPMKDSRVKVVCIIPLGVKELVGIETSTRTLIAEGVVSHNSPPFPQLVGLTLEFTLEELEENWKWINARRNILDSFLNEQAVPTPFTYNMEWECKYCRHKIVCDALEIAARGKDG